jgi:hypothetical protein
MYGFALKSRQISETHPFSLRTGQKFGQEKKSDTLSMGEYSLPKPNPKQKVSYEG